MFQSVEVEEERVDERSVEDLLTFINGGDGGICKTCFVFFIHIRLLTDCNFLHINFESCRTM